MSPDFARGIACSADDDAPTVERAPVRLAAVGPVLIVDDNYHAAVELARLLEEMDVAARCVGQCDAAREAARESKPKIALVDINLAGGFEGVDLAREMQALYGTKIVFVTAYHVRDLMHRLAGAESMAVLFKPVEPDILATVLSQVSTTIDGAH